MKKIIYFLLGYFLIINNTHAISWAGVKNLFSSFFGGWGAPRSQETYGSMQNEIIPNKWIIINLDHDWKWLLFSLLWYVRDSIFWLLMVIAISVFIWIWARLLMARWNPEDFKKWLMHFLYAIIWLFVIAASWSIVKMISSLDL